MNFIFEEKVMFGSLDICIFVLGKSTNFKMLDVNIDIAAYWKLHFCLFLLNPKYYQNEIWSNTNAPYNKHF